MGTTIKYGQLNNLSPAQVNRKTGVITINTPIFRNLPADTQFFVIQHENGHYHLQTRDELACDNYAFDQYAKQGKSLKACIRALTQVLKFRKPQDYERVRNLLKRAALYDVKINGHENAGEILKKLNSTRTMQSPILSMTLNQDLNFLEADELSASFDGDNRSVSFFADAYAQAAGAAMDLGNNIMKAFTGDPEKKAAAEQLVGVLTESAKLPMAQGFPFPYPSDLDDLMVKMYKIPGVAKLGAWPAKAKDSMLKTKKAAQDSIREYNNPLNIATRKFYRALYQSADKLDDKNLAYALKVFFEEASKLGFKDDQLQSTIKKTNKFGGIQGIEGAYHQALEASKPSGFGKPEDYVQFKPDDLEFVFPAGKSMGVEGDPTLSLGGGGASGPAASAKSDDAAKLAAQIKPDEKGIGSWLKKNWWIPLLVAIGVGLAIWYFLFYKKKRKKGGK